MVRLLRPFILSKSGCDFCSQRKHSVCNSSSVELSRCSVCLNVLLHLHAVIVSVIAKAQLVGWQAILFADSGAVRVGGGGPVTVECERSLTLPRGCLLHALFHIPLGTPLRPGEHPQERTPSGQGAQGLSRVRQGASAFFFRFALPLIGYTLIDTKTMICRLMQSQGVRTLCDGNPLLLSCLLVVSAPGYLMCLLCPSTSHRSITSPQIATSVVYKSRQIS